MEKIKTPQMQQYLINEEVVESYNIIDELVEGRLIGPVPEPETTPENLDECVADIRYLDYEYHAFISRKCCTGDERWDALYEADIEILCVQEVWHIEDVKLKNALRQELCVLRSEHRQLLHEYDALRKTVTSSRV